MFYEDDETIAVKKEELNTILAKKHIDIDEYYFLLLNHIHSYLDWSGGISERSNRVFDYLHDNAEIKRIQLFILLEKTIKFFRSLTHEEIKSQKPSGNDWLTIGEIESELIKAVAWCKLTDENSLNSVITDPDSIDVLRSFKPIVDAIDPNLFDDEVKEIAHSITNRLRNFDGLSGAVSKDARAERNGDQKAMEKPIKEKNKPSIFRLIDLYFRQGKNADLKKEIVAGGNKKERGGIFIKAIGEEKLNEYRPVTVETIGHRLDEIFGGRKKKK